MVKSSGLSASQTLRTKSSTVISGRSPRRIGGAGGSDATVDVQLAAGFFVPSADVGSLKAGEAEAPVDKLERQLAAVGVRGQRQVDAQLGSAIEDVGIVAQKDVDHVRHHQFFGSRSTRCPG
jgi:hypothetical protein